MVYGTLVAVSKRRKAPGGRRGADRRTPGRARGGLDVSYVCDNCGAEIAAATGEPGSGACPICEHPRPAPGALAGLTRAVRAHQRAQHQLDAALSAVGGERAAEVARVLGLPESTARRWLQQGPPNPWRASRSNGSGEGDGNPGTPSLDRRRDLGLGL